MRTRPSDDSVGVETHPSYALLGFCHRNYTYPHTLFGSSTTHSGTVEMVLREAKVTRGLNSDVYSGGHELIRLEMSETQFAELVSHMSMGDGVPVTLLRKNGETIPSPPLKGKSEIHLEEFKAQLEGINKSTRKMIEKVRELFSATEKKQYLTKGERKEILDYLVQLEKDIQWNQIAQLERFQEQMAKTVREVKNEIESFARNRFRLPLKKSGENAFELIAWKIKE